MNHNAEEVFPFGNVNTVVRIGDTVHRTTGPWTRAVHALLKHLEAAGFEASPRVLRMDEHGREVLTYIAGKPANRPWPEVLRSDEGLRRIAVLIRRFHDVVRNFIPPIDAHWRTEDRGLLKGEIIGHGDLGPWNTIWKQDWPVGLIDWDMAYPGPVWNDVATAALFSVPLRDDDACFQAGFSEVPDRGHRLRVFAEAYGVHADIDLIDHVLRIQHEDHERITRRGASGEEPWASFLQRGLAEESQREAHWIASHRHLFI